MNLRSRLHTCFFAVVFACAALAKPAWAYDDRVALVIGNDSYPSEPLRNAVNDARAVAKTLTDLGFKVVVKTNADINTMRSAAVEFSRLLEGANAAVFYYAGHGIQYRDKNFLIPVDAKLTSEAEIVYHALEVGQILENMDDAKVRFKFIVLDACRNNPFRNVFSSTGLAKLSKVPPGTIISYAAAAGSVAADSATDGENGLYTKHFLKEVRDMRVPAGEMFARVQTAVATESRNLQLPEVYSTPLPRGAFVFADRGGGTTTASAGAANQTVSGDAQASLDREFWTSIKDGKNLNDFQAYLDQFPNGTFARLARNRIASLRGDAVAGAALAEAGPSASAEAAPSVTAAAPKVALAAISPPAAARTETRSIEIKQPEIKAAVAPVQNTPPPEIKAAVAPAVASPVKSVAVPEPKIQLAAIAPEQKSALPAVPPVPKILAGLIEYRDGAKYNGEYKVDRERREIRDGKGEFIGKEFRYKGGFKDDKREGQGVYVWANGDRYEGTFNDDEANGRGVWTFARGDKYEGEVVKGKILGKGVFTSSVGDRIEGTFRNSVANGRALYVFANGDKYEGDMVDGKINGKGVYTAKTGDKTEATFVDGNADGKGIYYFPSGDRYEGDFKRGALTGQGVYHFSNGLRAEGEYLNGNLKGKGAFYFNDGSWFEGIFEDGLKRAVGIIIAKDGAKRAATMVDGKVIINP